MGLIPDTSTHNEPRYNNRRQTRSFYPTPTPVSYYRWPKEGSTYKVRYILDNFENRSSEVTRVERIMQEYEDNTKIDFVRISSRNAYNYILNKPKMRILPRL